MGKAINILILSILFICIGTGITAKYIKNKTILQEQVLVDLKIRGSYLKTRYVIRFSTEDKKGNFKIVSKEKDIEL